MSDPLASLRAAVEAYDAHDDALDAIETNEAMRAWTTEEQRLGEAVGLAFWELTKNINNRETCRQLVRPGPRELRPGDTQLSLVRRTLKRGKL
ncbi:hypothetical protein Rctr197k_153 [Virus Rctr197k]|nr:hypothetical protein Rctr197k_153 [Virus Rctr197k]